MRKLYLILFVIVCASILLGSITTFADAMDDGVLTVEEAKTLALKNNVNYNYQDKKIQDAKDNYAKLSEGTSAISGRGSNTAEKAAARISWKIQLENAYSNVRKAVLTKDDLKRSSDREVTDTFYAVIEAQNSVTKAQADLELKKRSLEKSTIKYDLNIIAKDSFSQAETSFKSSEDEYKRTVKELENCVLKLSKSIGKEVDLTKIELDTTLKIPDISILDLKQIKKDNLKNNLTYFTAKEQYKLAEYELALTEEKYEDYLEDRKKASETVEKRFDDLIYDAKEKFEDAEYSYNEKLESLDDTIQDQYNNLADLYESYLEQKKDLKDMELTVKKNQVKNIMGIINESELDSSTANLENMRNQLISAIISLNNQYTNMTQYSETE